MLLWVFGSAPPLSAVCFRLHLHVLNLNFVRLSSFVIPLHFSLSAVCSNFSLEFAFCSRFLVLQTPAPSFSSQPIRLLLWYRCTAGQNTLHILQFAPPFSKGTPPTTRHILQGTRLLLTRYAQSSKSLKLYTFTLPSPNCPQTINTHTHKTAEGNPHCKFKTFLNICF